MIIGIAGYIALPPHLLHALSIAEIEETARTTTVQIASSFSIGSGVVIKRRGDTYTVLTATHTIDPKQDYSVIPTDGTPVKVSANTIKNLPNLDLTLLAFTSSKSYPTAVLGDSSQVRKGQPCYISGFPTENIHVTQGVVTTNLRQTLYDGYTMACSNRALPGMSGGPIFNQEGQLIGIAGKFSTLNSDPLSSDASTFSAGVPINTFLRAAPSIAPQLSFQPAIKTSESQPTTSMGFLLIAFSQGAKKDYEGAITSYGKVLALNPQQTWAYIFRGAAYGDSLKPFQALTDFNTAISLNPRDPLGYYMRGRHYAWWHNLDSGHADLAKADLQMAAQLAKQYNLLKLHLSATQKLRELE